MCASLAKLPLPTVALQHDCRGRRAATEGTEQSPPKMLRSDIDDAKDGAGGTGDAGGW